MPTPRLALLLALGPAALVLAVMAIAGEASPMGAIAVAVLAAAGVAWTSRREPVSPAPEPARTEASAFDNRILDGLPDPVIVVDGRRAVVSANGAARDVLAIAEAGHDLARSLRHPAALELVDAAIAEGREGNAKISLPGPHPRRFRVLVRPRGEGGDESSGGAIVVLHDLTTVERAEQMRVDFVANVSHELRTPLSALTGFIETLQGAARDDAEAREHFLGIMHNEALRMGRLIDDLLSLSQVEINEHVPPQDRVDIARLLENVTDILARRAEEKGMTLDLECAPDLPPVTGDADQLTQVFQNLVDNAIKYGRQRTPVRIAARIVDRLADSDAPGVAVAVTDQGEGIPEADLPRLTERFYRVDKARSRSLGGTGLGLAIVKHIVNRHRGRLGIDSVAGEGSTFTVTLPAAPARPDD
jgi:two-component system phosphate regulon sensor histidine kinase PhoR